MNLQVKILIIIIECYEGFYLLWKFLRNLRFHLCISE